MKTITFNYFREQCKSAGLLLLLGLALGGKPLPAGGGILEPDAVFYGNIISSNIAATAARTDLMVEARRTLLGSPVAAYQMGASASAGNFYLLRIKLESPPLTQPDTVAVGDTVYLVLKSGSAILTQTAVAITERGEVVRMDLEVGADPGGNGLPDAWELSTLGIVGQDPDIIAANGLTLLENYVAGTDPNDRDSLLKVQVTLSNNVPHVRLPTRAATGPGYEGMVRLYSLEYSTSLTANAWMGIVNYTNIVGSNQILTYQAQPTWPPQFFRGRVRLEAK